MAYIGREPQIGNFQVCDAISTVNGQAAYTMQVSSVNVSPESANHMLVSLNGILQRPGSSFTVSGSTITFASNLVTGDVINFIHILGSVLDLGVPSDSTVSLAKLTATGTKNSTTFLRGDNTFAAAGGTNTPAFYAYLTANQTGIPNTSHTKIAYNAELYDIGNGFNTSTNTYTIPESGKYYFSFGVRRDNTSGNRYLIEIYKNGSSIQDFETGAGSAYGTSHGNMVQAFSANDTVAVYLYQNSGGNSTVRGGNGAKDTWMYGFKIIE